MVGLLDQGAVVTLRGAGTINGIDPVVVDGAVELINEQILRLVDENSKVALIYDGDVDNRQRPDIGSVFGLLADKFADNPLVTTIAAQKKSWYLPEAPNSPIQSASGTPYETYVFPDNLPGGHARLTQSEKLVRHPKYRQIFVGPVGNIGFEQLEDLSIKAIARPEDADELEVRVISTNNNPAVENDLLSKLSDPNISTDRAREIENSLKQRSNFPRGFLFMQNGDRVNLPHMFPGIQYEWVDL